MVHARGMAVGAGRGERYRGPGKETGAGNGHGARGNFQVEQMLPAFRVECYSLVFLSQEPTHSFCRGNFSRVFLLFRKKIVFERGRGFRPRSIFPLGKIECLRYVLLSKSGRQNWTLKPKQGALSRKAGNNWTPASPFPPVSHVFHETETPSPNPLVTGLSASNGA